MAIQVEMVEQGNDVCIQVGGEVDLYTSPDLRSAISKAVPKAKGVVRIDLSAVAYMDSSGVATLVEGLRSAGKEKIAFALAAPSQAVMKVLQLSRLDTVFTIEEAA